MAVARINEAALLRAGVDRATVEALRHMARQVGEQTGGTTLPQVADEQAGVLNPALVALQLALQLLTARVGVTEAEEGNLPVSDKDLRRQIEELSAELQEARISLTALEKRIETLENGVD